MLSRHYSIILGPATCANYARLSSTPCAGAIPLGYVICRPVRGESAGAPHPDAKEVLSKTSPWRTLKGFDHPRLEGV